MPSKVLFREERRETLILRKLLWGRMRVSGYFAGGGAGKVGQTHGE